MEVTPDDQGITYVLVCEPTGALYVGATRYGKKTCKTASMLLRHRWSSHVADAKAGRNSGPCVSIRRYGVEAFKKYVAFEGSLVSCHVIEEFLIGLLDSCHHGMNRTYSGGRKGLIHSSETRQRIGDVARGRPHSEEARKKMSDAAKRRVRRGS